jgi:predicted acetyltransferase
MTTEDMTTTRRTVPSSDPDKDLAVRPIERSEVDRWIQSKAVGFLTHPHEGEGDYYVDDMDLGRSWGAFDGTTVVGTLRSFATPLTVPGPAEVTSAALTNVTVSPTHRRRGLLTQMITRDLRQSAERGEPVGILIASEYPIYGQFGYGAAVHAATYTVDTRTARFLRSAVGRVELVDLATLRRLAPPVYERVRAAQPGAIGRNDRWWDRTTQQVEIPGVTPTPGYQAVYRGPDQQVEGYVRYTASSQWDQMRPKGTLSVAELVAATPEAYLGLWRYCCDVDLITRVEAGDRSIEEPLAWLLSDGRSVRQSGQFDFLWVRILDVATALAARRYPTEARLVLDVVDPLGITGGRFVLDGSPTGASCTPTDSNADLSVPIDSLGSLYLGGISALTLADAGRIDEHTSGAVLKADSLFRSPVVPWCSTWF